MELGSGSSESSTVEQAPRQNHGGDQTVDVAFHDDHDEEGFDESSELELGLGLSLSVLGSQKNINKNNNNNNDDDAKIVVKNSSRNVGCSSASSCSSLGLRISSKNSTTSGLTTTNNNNNNVSVGTKRAVSPTAVSQVVGWPPIRSYRMSSMASQAKSMAADESKGKEDGVYGAEDDKANAVSKDKVLPRKSSLFVKVNMDGVAIGRKVDLSVHSSYASLAKTLEEMFDNQVEKSNSEELILMPKVTRPSKLLDGTSDLVLTYEDKDGDWMLVGDVPWRMFVTSVKRLKIMRKSEANGLAPRFEDRSLKQKCRPI